MITILVLFHSVSEHIWRLAEAVAKGAASLDGCEATLRQVPELVDAERIFGPDCEEGRKAFADVETATIDDLVACDGFAIGTPVHYGNASSATRFFVDQTVKQYLVGTFIDKPATVFVSSAVGVGLEAAIQSVWSILAVHGMTIVPVGMRAPFGHRTRRRPGTRPGAGGSLARLGPAPGELARYLARRQTSSAKHCMLSRDASSVSPWKPSKRSPTPNSSRAWMSSATSRSAPVRSLR